tara:strand:- start:4178 stop:5173 length:996 start_codon:yes stop_codon:yes gene_type:complete
MSNEVAIIRQRNNESADDATKDNIKGQALSGGPNASYKGLQIPSFNSADRSGATIVKGEADSVLFMGQDRRYGAAIGGKSKGGDFANKIILGVGFLNEGKTGDTDIDLESPNVRIGAGITIYQRTATGKDNVFDDDIKGPKTAERMATGPVSLENISSVEILGDIIEVKGRQGINIIAGIDPTMPTYGGESSSERANMSPLGVNLIYGNPTKEELNDEKSPYSLHGIAKGPKVVKALSALNDRVSELNGTVFSMQTDMMFLQTILAIHTHPTALVYTLPSPELAITVVTKSFSDVYNFLKLATGKINQVSQVINMSPISTDGISSDWNKTN